uniref:G_PROTEIN_RECEP_F1_2 domain-containing protein n=1 Tax=Meloidogyne hapla TaxID=6305 RepID=A0A1I8B1M0_MELHA
MELYIFQHNEYERLYNCTNIEINSIPLEQRRLTTLALINLILSTIYFLLYLPCFYSIWKQHWKNDCYTILLYIGIIDINALLIIGFIQSWLSLQGAVFCSYPTLIYIFGSISLSLWIAESTADIILAINRCLEVIAPKIAEILFKGMRTHIWLIICSLYALYWLFFAKTIVFSGIYFAWFFNPFFGYKEDINGEFAYNFHIIHDLSVAILSPGIYLLFALSLFIKNRALRRNLNIKKDELNTNINSRSISISNAEKLTFLQVVVISLINTICGSIYSVMQHITPEKWMIVLAQFSW